MPPPASLPAGKAQAKSRRPMPSPHGAGPTPAVSVPSHATALSSVSVASDATEADNSPAPPLSSASRQAQKISSSGSANPSSSRMSASASSHGDSWTAASTSTPGIDVSTSTRDVWLLDTETTGLSRLEDRIVEIAVMQYAPVRVSSRSWLVHPGRSIPASAVGVHGIGDSEVADAPSFAEVWNSVVSTVCAGEERPLVVAHNATFDRGFVEAELTRAGLALPAWDWACSISKVARTAWPGQSASLGNLAKALGIGDFGHHRAAADVAASAKVLDAAAQVLGTQGGLPAVMALVEALEKSARDLKNGPGAKRVGVTTRAAAGAAAGGSSAAAVSEGVGQSSRALSAIPGGSAGGSSSSCHGEDCEESSSTTRRDRPLVYIVRGGKVWHKSLKCGSLSRSKEIDALTSQPEDRPPCAICAKPQAEDCCCVCTEPLEGNAGVGEERETTTLPCGHVFHSVCIAAWTRRHRSCPICRMAFGASGKERATPDSPVPRSSLAHSGPTAMLTSPVTPVARGGSALSRYDGSSSRSRDRLYGTSSGECYHMDPSCIGLRRAHKVQELSSIVGRRPCKVCIVDGDMSLPTERVVLPPGAAPRRLRFGGHDHDVETSSFGLSTRGTRAISSSLARSADVFVAPTGAVWHTTSACPGLRKAVTLSRLTSVPPGRRPCKLCAC